MRKTIFILGILLVLVFSGCAKQYVCSDGKTVSDPALCIVKETPAPITNIPSEPKQEVVQQPVEQPKPVVKEIDVDIQKLFDKAKTMTNYEYDYTAPKNGFVARVSVLNNNLKILFTKGPQVYLGYKYDTVYFDTVKKSAVAMCTTLGDCENMTAAKQEDYNRVYVKTPLELIDEVVYAKLTGEEMMDNRNSKVVDYKLSDGETGRMWIDIFYGVPLKRLFTMDGEQVSATYFSFSKDSAKAVEVVVPAKAEFI